jgi:hypothetical protein
MIEEKIRMGYLIPNDCILISVDSSKNLICNKDIELKYKGKPLSVYGLVIPLWAYENYDFVKDCLKSNENNKKELRKNEQRKRK